MTGQIRLSGHISASFNENSGSQTSMSDYAVRSACHETSTWNPTQKNMNVAHGLITCVMLNDRYSNTNYGTGYNTWPANTSTFSSIYNKQDTRPDGSLYSNSSQRAPSVESYGTHGHTLTAVVYDGQGAIYCNALKKLNNTGTTIRAYYRYSSADGRKDDHSDTTAGIYLHGYPSSYLEGIRDTRLDTPFGIGTNAAGYQHEGTVTGIRPDLYPYLTFGYRGYVEYPGYGSRIGTLNVKPHYIRLVAYQGY